MATARVQLTLEQAQFINGINAAQARIARFGSALRGMALFVAGGFAAKMGTTATFGVVKGATDAAGRIESMTAAMSVFTGQLQTAKDLTVDLMKAGAASPFGSEQYAKAGKALLGFGLSIEQMKKAIPMLSDVAAAVEANLDELAIVFGKNAAQGRLYTRDVNEFATRGIRIWQALADEIGVPITKIRKAVEEGKVGTKEMFGAFERLTSKGGAYQGMTEQFRRTFEGAKKQLEGAWFMFSAKMGEPINRALKPLFADIVGLLQGMEGIASRIGNAIANVVRLVRLAYTNWDAFFIVTQKIGTAMMFGGLQFVVRLTSAAREAFGQVIAFTMGEFAKVQAPPIFEKLRIAWLGFKLTVIPLIIDAFATLGMVLEGVLKGVLNRLADGISDVIRTLPIPWSEKIADKLVRKSGEGFMTPGGEVIGMDDPRAKTWVETLGRLRYNVFRNYYIDEASKPGGAFQQKYGRLPNIVERAGGHMGDLGAIASEAMVKDSIEAIPKGREDLIPEMVKAIREGFKEVEQPTFVLENEGLGLALFGGNKYTEGGLPRGMLDFDPQKTKKAIGDALRSMTGFEAAGVQQMSVELERSTKRLAAFGDDAPKKNLDFFNMAWGEVAAAFNRDTGLEDLVTKLASSANAGLYDAVGRNGIPQTEDSMSLQEPNREYGVDANKLSKVVDDFQMLVSDVTRRDAIAKYKKEYEDIQKQISGLQREDEMKRLKDLIDGVGEKPQSQARIASIVADSFAKVGAGGISVRTTPTVLEIAARETANNTREIWKLQLKMYEAQIAAEKADDTPYFGTLN